MIWHVYPLNDLIEHELVADACVCGPQVKYQDGMLVLHHSLDGRELSEPDYEPETA